MKKYKIIEDNWDDFGYKLYKYIELLESETRYSIKQIKENDKVIVSVFTSITERKNFEKKSIELNINFKEIYKELKLDMYSVKILREIAKPDNKFNSQYTKSLCRFNETKQYIEQVIKENELKKIKTPVSQEKIEIAKDNKDIEKNLSEDIKYFDGMETDSEKLLNVDEELIKSNYEANKKFLINKITNNHTFFQFHQRLETVVENALYEKTLRKEIIKGSKYKNVYEKKCYPSFEYFVINKDSSERKLSIPNPLLYAEFIENTLENLDYFIRLYSKINNMKIAVLQSQFIYENGEFCDTTSYYGTDDAYGIDEYRIKESIPYVLSKRKEFELSITFRYQLSLDISNFFSSIYTHVFERISKDTQNILKTCATQENKKYIAYLDKYNMDINNAETNGIITGPFSSKISSEVILTYIDLQLCNYIVEKGWKMKYVRYVDDYTFYANSVTELGKLEEYFNKILSDVRLTQNSQKKKL